jgi:RNA polymerase sigma factor (sigma-70 family)
VKAGEVLTVLVPPPEPAEPEGEAIPLTILHEDDQVIVIDKPAGLVVHPAAGHQTGTLVNALIAHCGETLSGIGGVMRPGIVHRLDKDTSGVMVVAKTDKAHQSLSAQFADHGRTGDLERGYVALVWGVPDRTRGTVDAPIDRHPQAATRWRCARAGARRSPRRRRSVPVSRRDPRFPMLEPQEEYMLAKSWREHGDRDAAHKLVTSHLRLVAKIAMGYRGYGLPISEVISEGNVGLMQAVKRFEPDKGFRLATYAMWWIKASIQEYILRSWSLVKMGTTANQKKLFFNLRKAKSKISALGEGDLKPDQVKQIAKRSASPSRTWST